MNPIARRLMPNSVLSHSVTSPAGPSVAMKAKASGTPAKFDATPEKVSKRAADTLGKAAEDHRRGHGKARRTSQQCRDQRQLDRGPVGAADRVGVQVDQVLQREAAVRRLERADDDLHRRQDQEQKRKDHEGQDAQPFDGQAPSGPAQDGASDMVPRLSGSQDLAALVRGPAPKRPGRAIVRSDHSTLAPTTASQPPVTAALLASTSSSVGK